ncbi:glutamate receptor ionotropic, kainate 2-like isoform X3 [Diabrotica virgifera virgifera]|uniref:Glutamate receptor ionotropic, kainate 2-like n=1 Tax=Diabrotica virgifera virgifera TaxID=50390 RepID=A0ABM5JWM9_DIAVI|nr:glutamate receptor ionotropic, kainate 2-like isoform X3 [Diabrotica virgifera virgifera]
MTFVSRLVCLILMFSSLTTTRSYKKKVYNIGGIFTDESQALGFRIATYRMNDIYPHSGIELETVTYQISPFNSLEAYKSTCDLLGQKIVGLFGPSSYFSSTFVQSVCDAKEIPHIETHMDYHMRRNESLVNLHPQPRALSMLFRDLVEAYGWRRVVVLYEDEESLLTVEFLMQLNEIKNINENKGKQVLLKQLETTDSGNYRTSLLEVKALGETNYVLVCSLNILEEVLKQLQQVGMMTDHYNYLITNLDTQTVDLSPFQYAGTNITAIRMLNPDSKEVTQITENIQKMSALPFSGFPILLQAWKTKLDTALIIDAVQLFYETIYELTKDKKKIIRGVSLSCSNQSNWNEGYTITNLMKSRTFEGLSGTVKFDGEGFRTDFKIDLLELTLGGLIKVGEWNSSRRSLSFHRPDRKNPNEEENPFNRTFKVLISINPPYQMLKDSTTQLLGNERYEGYGIDLIEELSKILGFNYTFELQADGKYGILNKVTGKWDGMMGEIIDGRADLAITDLTITSERESAVDFSEPFMNLGITILYKKPEPVPPSLFMFISPFSFRVWTMLGVSYLIVSISIFIMGRLSPSEWQNPYPCVEEPEFLINQFSIRNSFWFTIGALMQQGSELAAISSSTRAASGFWFFFVLTMVSSYTANLAAFLTVTTLVTPFNNIDELAQQTEIQFGAKKGGATANYFRDSNLTKYKKIWSYMARNSELMMTDNDDAVKKVESENYAFLMESTTIEYVIERHCTLARVGPPLDDKGYGIAMKRQSPYRNDISTAILQLKERGVLTGLKIKWWKEKRGGGKCTSKEENSEATPLDLQNVGGVFLVLFVGSIMATIGSMIELTLYIYRKSKRDNISFKAEFKKEMRFFIQFKQNTREVNILPNENTSNKNLINAATYI